MPSSGLVSSFPSYADYSDSNRTLSVFWLVPSPWAVLFCLKPPPPLPVSVRASLLPSGRIRCIFTIGQVRGKAFHSIAFEKLDASNAASLWLPESWSIGRSAVIAYQATLTWHESLSVQPQVQFRLEPGMA